VPIRDYDELFLEVGTAMAGSEIALKVLSFGNRTRAVNVRLAKFQYPGPVIATRRPAAVHGLRIDYGSVASADVPLPEGVYIRDVDRGSPAEAKLKELLERGRWIITSVNGKPTPTPVDFYREAGLGRGPLELRIVEVARNAEATARSVTLP